MKPPVWIFKMKLTISITFLRHSKIRPFIIFESFQKILYPHFHYALNL